MKRQTKGQDSLVRRSKKEDLDLKYQLKKYDVMNNLVLNTLQDSLTHFREGNFENIDEEVLCGELAQILIDNTNFSKKNLGEVDSYDYKKTIFFDYKSACFKILDGLKRGILLDNENNTLLLHKQRCDEILKDKDSIVEYYKERFCVTNIFGDNEITTELKHVPLLKREYEVYIERHGFPEGAIFDNELLAAIIKELIDSGELDENYCQ